MPFWIALCFLCFLGGLAVAGASRAGPAMIPHAHRSLWRGLVAAQVALPRGAPADRPRAHRADPADQRREPAVGRAAHPWRAAQARLRALAIDGVALHAAAGRQADAGLGHLPEEPCTGDRGDRHAVRADARLRAALCVRRAGPRAPDDPACRGDRPPERAVGSRIRSARPSHRMRSRRFWCATTTAPMASPSTAGCARWESAIGRPRRIRRGRTAMSSG